MGRKKLAETPTVDIQSQLPDITTDPRVVELARCVAFALGSFKNKVIYDQPTQKMEGWHQWFVRALVESGFKD